MAEASSFGIARDVGEGHLADMQTAAQNAAFEEGADAGGSEYMP
jgi:hypothetical protein